MQHTIPVMQLMKSVGPQIEAMTKAVESCVHCGFCLAVCPTYQILSEEMDSPRGRILLMKTALEGELSVEETLPYIERCLGCLACVTACPSGVQYEQLVMPYRSYARRQVAPSLAERLQWTLLRETLPHPGRFRAAAAAGKLAQPLKGALPGGMQAMLALLPERLPAGMPLPNLVPAQGERRARVALLAGCVQQALDPQLNWATLRVLAKNGVEIVIPAGQGCCGALLMHEGDQDGARRLARANLSAFPQDVDAILTNAAGCGSGIKAYELLFKGFPEQEQASSMGRRVKDVSEFLDELGLITPPPLAQPIKAVYHDACHLAHAQGIREAPRRLLSAIPNLTLLEIAEGDMCCGSAGTYNIQQPQIAARLGQRKSENILRAEGEAVVTGNIGCMVQIRDHLDRMGQAMPVYHTFELLDMAYQ